MDADMLALRHLMAAKSERTRIAGDTARRLRSRGLVKLCGCSDGDYVELTDKGRAEIAEAGDGT